MSINAERSKMIRDKIKAELGYNSRQVSIRSGDCGYSDYTKITVKDLSCDIDAIKQIAKSFESIRYDEYCGEILSGANTYINIEYDWEILRKAEEAELENAEKAIKDASDLTKRKQCFYTDKKGGRYVIIPTDCQKYDRNGNLVDCHEYCISYFAPDKGYGDNLTCGTESFERAKWTIARYLAINKARAA